MSESWIERRGLKFDEGFARTPNAWARDESLSLKARGLLTLILSHDKNFRISVRQLIATNPEGRSAIDSAIAELKSHDYLDHELLRSRIGRIEGTVWFLTDPAEVAERRRRAPQLDFPRAGKTASRKNRHTVNQHIEEEQEEEDFNPGVSTNPSTRAGEESDALTGADPLDALWQTCPVSHGRHDFDPDHGWCVSCAQANSDGSLRDLNGKSLRTAQTARTS